MIACHYDFIICVILVLHTMYVQNTFSTERLNHMSDNTYNNDFNTTNTNPYEYLNDNITNLNNTETPQSNTTPRENIDDALYQNTPSRPDPITFTEDQDPVSKRTEYVIRPEGDTEVVHNDDNTENNESFTDKISEGFDNFKEKVEDVFDSDDEQAVDDDDLALQEVLDEPLEDNEQPEPTLPVEETTLPVQEERDLPIDLDPALETPTQEESTLPVQDEIVPVDDTTLEETNLDNTQATVDYHDNEDESEVRVVIYADEIESGEETSGDVFQEISHKLDEIIELMKNRNV